jgi:hypothetical protein
MSAALKGNKRAIGSRGSTGYKFTPEQIERLRQSHLGQKSWNKGKKGLQVSWNKGLKGLKRNRTIKIAT